MNFNKLILINFICMILFSCGKNNDQCLDKKVCMLRDRNLLIISK